MRTREETLEAKRKWMSEWRASHPEEAKTKDRLKRLKARQTRAVEMREYFREYAAKRRRTEKHKDDLAVRKRGYHANPEPHLRRSREYAQSPEGKAYRKAYMLKWREANKDKVVAYLESYRSTARDKHRERMLRMRRAVIQAYGGFCVCCKESIPEFLSLDHVNNDGKAHRKELGNGNGIYLWARKNNYPKDRLQVLCTNCNLAKYRHGICPHQRVIGAETSE